MNKATVNHASCSHAESLDSLVYMISQSITGLMGHIYQLGGCYLGICGTSWPRGCYRLIAETTQRMSLSSQYDQLRHQDNNDMVLLDPSQKQVLAAPVSPLIHLPIAEPALMFENMHSFLLDSPEDLTLLDAEGSVSSATSAQASPRLSPLQSPLGIHNTQYPMLSQHQHDAILHEAALHSQQAQHQRSLQQMPLQQLSAFLVNSAPPSPRCKKYQRSKELRFACPHCPKRFSRQEHLVRHEKTHTGERAFVCQYCHQRFSRRDNVLVHERSHEQRHDSPAEPEI